MSGKPATGNNWFVQGGASYARHRPEYPPELAAWLAEISPDRQWAVDVGCGSGQLSFGLAGHFSQVVGLDPSSDQLQHSRPALNLVYIPATAEALPIPDRQASLITASQAAHWFDLPSFYREVRRIARPQAVLALISYSAMQLDDVLQDRFQTFYRDVIGPWWPPERRLVDQGYRDIEFPFPVIQPPSLQIFRKWDLAALTGYIDTWSAVRRARQAGRGKLIEDFALDIARQWGDPCQTRPVRWPINMRTGRL